MLPNRLEHAANTLWIMYHQVFPRAWHVVQMPKLRMIGQNHWLQTLAVLSKKLRIQQMQHATNTLGRKHLRSNMTCRY